MPQQRLHADRVFWRQETTTQLLRDIPANHRKVRRFVSDPNFSRFYQKFSYEWLLKFLTDCNRGEGVGTKTMNTTQNSLLRADDATRSRSDRYTLNLSAAVTYLFGDHLEKSELQHPFTPQLAKKLNQMIGAGLFDGAGEYRHDDTEKAAVLYGWPPVATIEKEMEELFRYVRRKKARADKCYNLGAEFLARFLYLRPFPNGNGLTARLLLSALLIEDTVVPMTLNTLDPGSNIKEILVKCLIRAYDHGDLSWLRALVIEGVVQSSETATGIIEGILDDETWVEEDDTDVPVVKIHCLSPGVPGAAAA